MSQTTDPKIIPVFEYPKWCTKLNSQNSMREAVTAISEVYEKAGLSGKLTVHFGTPQFRKKGGSRCQAVSVSDTNIAVVFKTFIEKRDGTWLVSAFAALQGTAAVAAFAAIQAIKADKPEESAPTPVLTATAAAPRPAPPEKIAPTSTVTATANPQLAEGDEEASLKSPFHGFVRDEIRRGVLLAELLVGPHRMKKRDGVNAAVRTALLRARETAMISELEEPSVKTLGQIVGRLLEKGYIREATYSCRSDWKRHGEPYTLADKCWTEIGEELPKGRREKLEKEAAGPAAPPRALASPKLAPAVSSKIIRMEQPRVSPPLLPPADHASMVRRLTEQLEELKTIESEIRVHQTTVLETQAKIDVLEARATAIRQSPVVAVILSQTGEASAQEKRA